MQSSSVGPAPRFLCRPQPSECFVLPSVRLFDPSLGLDTVGDLVVADGRIEAGGCWGVEAGRGRGVGGISGLYGVSRVRRHARASALPRPGVQGRRGLRRRGRRRPAATSWWSAWRTRRPRSIHGPLAAWVLEQAVLGADVLVGQVGAVSRGLRGEELAELRELVDAGVAAFSDDGHPVADSDLLLTALRYLRGTGRPVLLHLEDRSLSIGGSMHEGAWSARLGIRGIPGAAESGPLAQALEVLRHTCREAEASATTPRGAGPRRRPCTSSTSRRRTACVWSAGRRAKGCR